MILKNSHIFQATLLLAGITNIACLVKAATMPNGGLFKLRTDMGSIVLMCSAIAVLLVFLGLINFHYLPVRKRKKRWVRLYCVKHTLIES